MNKPEARDDKLPAEDEVLGEVVANIREDAQKDAERYLEDSVVPEGGE